MTIQNPSVWRRIAGRRRNLRRDAGASFDRSGMQREVSGRKKRRHAQRPEVE